MQRLLTVENLKAQLRKMVSESIDTMASSMQDDPAALERQYQAAVAKSVNAGTKTSRISTKKQARPNEAEEDDIFSTDNDTNTDKPKKPTEPAQKKDAPAKEPAPASAESKPAPDQAADQTRTNRNSPEAAKFSLAQAQERAHEKEEKSASVVPTPRPDDLTFDMIVTALNIIRSGQSLKDERVRQEVEKYFSSFKGAERVALYSYLNGLAQIVAANVSSQQAPSPNDAPNPIEMDFIDGAQVEDQKKKVHAQKPGHETKQEKPNKNVKQKSSEDDEDTTPPITVGPRQQ